MTNLLEYPLTGKGVFVFVKQDTHYFQTPWHGLNQLDYETDRKRVMKTFNLTKSSHNVLCVDNLTNEPGKNGFDHFMDTFQEELISKDDSNEDASFVMFLLASHGIENGGVLLSTPEGAKEPVEPCKCNPLHHTAGPHCYVRYITKHIIDKVCKAYPAVPKIFLIQTCRGSERNVMAIGDADISIRRPDEEPPNDTELFLLNSPDSFLLRPCVEGNGCWAGVVKSNIGSFLISRFCEVLQELRQTANKAAKEREKLSRIKGNSGNPFEKLVSHQCLETITGGWLTNVCQYTTSLVANRLVTESSNPLDKQQPHYSSSLAYRLSCLKMLKTEWGEEDSYLHEWYEQLQNDNSSDL